MDVIARTKDKGFQGVMKRWGFHGQPASHGVSLTHRSRGSLGSRIGRVWKGTKMAGHMGGEVRPVEGMWVYKVRWGQQQESQGMDRGRAASLNSCLMRVD